MTPAQRRAMFANLSEHQLSQKSFNELDSLHSKIKNEESRLSDRGLELVKMKNPNKRELIRNKNLMNDTTGLRRKLQRAINKKTVRSLS